MSSEIQQRLCPIVLACDDAYGMPLATTLRSIVDSNPHAWPIEFYVLAHGITGKTKRKVTASLPKRSAVIRWIAVDLSAFSRFSTMSHISKVTYARFLISRVLPGSVSKLLYLDSDLLVLGDLRPLCETDLGGAALGAVVDSFMDPATKQDRRGYESVPRVGSYFNAGVLLIDLNRWRECRISEQMMEYMIQHPGSPYSDQDALNVVCDGRYRKLDSRWNVQDHDETRFSETCCDAGPAIVHFVTERKPWIAERLSLNTAFYDAFRNRTCFARTGWERATDFARTCWVRSKDRMRQWTLLRLVVRSIKRAAAN